MSRLENILTSQGQYDRIQGSDAKIMQYFQMKCHEMWGV